MTLLGALRIGVHAQRGGDGADLPVFGSAAGSWFTAPTISSRHLEEQELLDIMSCHSAHGLAL
jgi:hypothetical protein